MNRVRTRAMHRATRRLRNSHPDEYAAMYAEELAAAKTEALADIAAARKEHPGEQPPARKGDVGNYPSKQIAVPPRIVSGTRPDGVRRMRDDVARCPYCQQFHDRGHECTSCRARPAGAPERNPYARRRTMG